MENAQVEGVASPSSLRREIDVLRLQVGFIVQGEGVFLGNLKDSVWEDWGTLGKIRGITTPSLRILSFGVNLFHDTIYPL